MPEGSDARVPFAAIGVLLVVVSTMVTVYLMSMETKEVSRGIGDDVERDLSRALTLAVDDIGSALNYAGLSAESTVGKLPVVNASESSPFGTDGQTADDERIKYLTWQQLSRYLEANYNGSFKYGDYTVTAAPTGDYRSLSISPGNMTMYRKIDHPLVPCRKAYTAYYTLSAPLRLTVTRAGSDFRYSEDRTVRSLITARYPLLRALTSEYEARLNGTPLSFDLTAAAFAYTWARGYAQYATGAPLNIVDNGQVELIVNGATLLEQGFEYDSVDPMGLATLAYQLVNRRPAEVNGYDAGNNSKAGLPQNRTTPPDRYNFTIDDMVDRAYDNVSFGGYTENSLDGAYTVHMYVDIRRDRDCYPLENITYVTEERAEPGPPATPGEWPVLTRTFHVCRDNSDGRGFADRVTVTYVMTQYSALQYFGAGKYADTSERIDDPLLAGSSDDVASPLAPMLYEKALSFGRKAFTDDNLGDVVGYYEASFDRLEGEGSFEKTLADLIADREGWPGRVPAAFTDRSREIVCGPANNHPVWAEIEADYELQDLRKTIMEEVTVDLDPASYGDSPGAMSLAAYQRLESAFDDNYGRYLDRASYFCPTPPGGYCNPPAYRSCGAKAIYRIREAFLEDVRRQLQDAAGRSGDAINRTIDERMKGTGMNSSDLTAGAANAKSYLAEHFYIPFGLPMRLNSSAEFAGGYPWDESITLAIDQEPPYLGTGKYVDPETGYAVRPLRLRNVCLFSPAADVSWAGEIADAAADRTLAGIDAIAAAADDVADQAFTAEIDRLSNEISTAARGVLKDELASSAGGEVSLREYADRAVERAYDRRNGDVKAIVRDLGNGVLAKEIAAEIVNDSGPLIRRKAAEAAVGYVDEYVAYASGKIKEQVARAEHRAIVQITGRLKAEIRDAFRDFSKKATEVIAAKGTDAVLGRALGAVPSGLPLLPPWGWWATLNVWYIEVQGEIPAFTAYDADAEAVPDPIFGGRAISCTRRHQEVLDDQGRILGYDEPIRFSARTGTFILVPPGAQGVGDKTGGWDEKSPGYDEKGASS